MPASATEIANYALGVLGSKRITDIGDTTSKNARITRLHYDQARREVLRSHRWNFACRRATLSQHADAPNWGYSYQYPLPADFIRLDQVNEVSVWATQRADWFEVESGLDESDNPIGTVLLINASTVQVRYVADISDVSRFDPLFTQAFSTLLASRCARSITGSDSREAELRQQYEAIDLPKAQQVDGAESNSGENPPLIDAITRSYFVRARSSGGLDLPTPLAPTVTTNYPASDLDEVEVGGDW